MERDPRLYLRAAGQLIDEGIDRCGYPAWSLMDNFDWAQGYSRRLGRVFVELGNQRRILTSSAYWYQNLIALQSERLGRAAAFASCVLSPESRGLDEGRAADAMLAGE